MVVMVCTPITMTIMVRPRVTTAAPTVRALRGLYHMRSGISGTALNSPNSPLCLSLTRTMTASIDTHPRRHVATLSTSAGTLTATADGPPSLHHCHPFHSWARCPPSCSPSSPGTTVNLVTLISDTRTSGASGAATARLLILFPTTPPIALTTKPGTTLTIVISRITSTSLHFNPRTGRLRKSITPRALLRTITRCLPPTLTLLSTASPRSSISSSRSTISTPHSCRPTCPPPLHPSAAGPGRSRPLLLVERRLRAARELLGARRRPARTRPVARESRRRPLHSQSQSVLSGRHLSLRSRTRRRRRLLRHRSRLQRPRATWTPLERGRMRVTMVRWMMLSSP